MLDASGAGWLRCIVRPNRVMPEAPLNRASRPLAWSWVAQAYITCLLPIYLDGASLGSFGFSCCFAFLITYALTRGVYHDMIVLAVRMLKFLRRIRL